MDADADTELRLRRAVDFIPEGLAIFDAGLKLVASNARYRDLLELPPQLLEAGTPLYDLALFVGRRGDLGPGDAIQRAAERVETLTKAEGSIAQRLGKQGQTLEIRSSRLPEGGLVISFADVTARIAAEQALEQANLTLEGRVEERTATLTRVNTELDAARLKADTANRDKTRFLAAASHDLLQPLNAARLYTATLLEREADSEAGGLARSIEASLNAVEEIMSALLDISRIDSGALTPQPGPFRLSEMTQKIAVEFGPLAREKSIALELVGSSAVANADRSLVARIVQNLVSNAVKYTRPGGRVLVGVRRRGVRMRLDVIDTGIGFNRDQRQLLFAEFSRLEQGARMAPGLGLGLSIVERLVAAMGLTLELESIEGKGSRFSLYLPAGRMAPVPQQAAGRAETAASLAGLKVLCVDNERTILDAMNQLLTGWGCDVRLARSLKDIDKDRLLIGWLPDLVLMDYHLDQTSGLDAVEWLRHNVGGHLPAALLTADRTLAVRALAEERGISVVTKPVKPAALRAAISGLAAQRGRGAG
jgi:signal transduction histidine kinase/CheY-like chemotaxis protein